MDLAQYEIADSGTRCHGARVGGYVRERIASMTTCAAA